jgi:hypothetical protein
VIGLLVPWLLRGLPWLAAVLVVAGAGTWLHHAGEVDAEKRVTATYEARIGTLALQAASQHAKDEAMARFIEKTHAEELTAIAVKNQQDAKNEKAKTDKMVADVRAGTLRVRDRFTCPVTDRSSVPGAAASRPLDPSAREGGLQNEDAVVLVKLAGEADQVALTLSACQAVIRADREK